MRLRHALTAALLLSNVSLLAQAAEVGPLHEGEAVVTGQDDALLDDARTAFLRDHTADFVATLTYEDRLARKKVVLVAGHFCSGSSIPASQVYVEENILQISPASTNPTLTDRGYATVFRVCGRDDQQGPYAADFLMKSFAGKRVAIIHDKQSYSKGLAGSLSAPKVADALRAGSFKTVIGELGFNAKGDRKSTDYVVYRWHEGAYTQIADKP